MKNKIERFPSLMLMFLKILIKNWMVQSLRILHKIQLYKTTLTSLALKKMKIIKEGIVREIEDALLIVDMHPIRTMVIATVI